MLIIVLPIDQFTWFSPLLQVGSLLCCELMQFTRTAWLLCSVYTYTVFGSLHFLYLTKGKTHIEIYIFFKWAQVKSKIHIAFHKMYLVCKVA